MKAIIFAYHDMGCVGLKALVAGGYEIQAVFTHRDMAGENRFFASVARQAAEFNLPVFAPEDVNHPLWLQRIADLKPDVIFSFYYRQLLGREILALPARGAFNLHGSLLPRYRGCAPVNWVLIHGEQETGVTLHKMIQKPDAGDILGQVRVAITPDDTALNLHHKLCRAAESLLKELLPKLKDAALVAKPQNDAQASYFGRRCAAEGEINWSQSATAINNLVRALTEPWPGAFTWHRMQKLILWHTRPVNITARQPPGTVLSVEPLRIACGEGALEVVTGQWESGLYLQAAQLVTESGLVPGIHLSGRRGSAPVRRTRVLILGVNGFIGNHLTERLLREDHYEVYGMDIGSDAISRFIGNPYFHFVEGDISIHSEWIEYHIKKCDIVLPLVAIATPVEYTRNPLRVFELDFEENLKIVRYCVKYNKRIIFPSTSEVYGMCDDREFDEDNSRLIVGPVHKQRWIYSVSKQLLDRVIWAYGIHEGLKFTLFRPFNWMGPRLDNLDAARIGSSRVITQLILNLVEGSPIKLVDGGEQKRCFTDINDGIEALFLIIENRNGLADGQIINIGNPHNEASIRSLAEMLLRSFDSHPLRPHFPPFAGINVIESNVYYGKGYQDVEYRTPSIKNAARLLNWKPCIDMEHTVAATLDFFLQTAVKEKQQQGIDVKGQGGFAL